MSDTEEVAAEVEDVEVEVEMSVLDALKEVSRNVLQITTNKLEPMKSRAIH